MQSSKELKSQIRGFIVGNFPYGEDSENLTEDAETVELNLRSYMLRDYRQSISALGKEGR